MTMPETEWRMLRDELARWADAGRAATLWWRDDDAAQATPALDRLCALRAATGVPLALAVIPATVDETAAARIGGDPDLAVLQHGYAHRNHAAPEARKAELGPERSPKAVLRELDAGRRRLAALFGPRALAVLVPPWNRVADAVVSRLEAAGFTGLSTYGARAHPHPTPGLRRVNAHIDIIAWRSTRGFIGLDAALGLAVAHLGARRTGAVDGDEPTGLLSHHLVHDEASWDFVRAFAETTRAHAGARWLSAAQAFGTDR